MTAVYREAGGAKEVTLQDLYYQLSLLLDRLDYGLLTDNAKRLKVNLSEGGTLPGVSTVTTVSTVSAVTDHSRVGGMAGARLPEALLDAAYIAGILSNVTFSEGGGEPT